MNTKGLKNNNKKRAYIYAHAKTGVLDMVLVLGVYGLHFIEKQTITSPF